MIAKIRAEGLQHSQGWTFSIISSTSSASLNCIAPTDRR